MAKSYTSTVQLRCVKEHTCAGCGSVYQYPMSRKVVATSGRSAEDATQKCRAKVAATAQRDVDLQPCPACGLVQPDMVGRRRAWGHKRVLWIAILAVVVILIVHLANGLNAGPATWGLTGIVAIAALAFAAAEGIDPNADVDANRQRAADRVAAGTVKPLAQKRPTPTGMMRVDVPGRASRRWPLVGLVLLAPICAAAPEVIRSARAWPANDACYPPVVGPGDTTRVYLPRQIGSVKGLYRGTAQAVLSAPSVAAVAVPADTNQNNWGSTISDVKDSEKQSYHRPWVELTIPPMASLAGKTVDCAVHLDVEYPAIAPGDTKFQVEHTTMDERYTIRLSPPRAGAAFRSLWWSASAIAAAVLVVGGAGLLWSANRLRSRGTTTNVFPAA